MRYMGGKTRLRKYLLPFIHALADKSRMYVEPFVGGCNVIPYVHGFRGRYGFDIDPYLPPLYRAAAAGWVPPEYVPRTVYEDWRHNETYGRQWPALYAFMKYGCAFGGKAWGTYASNGADRPTEVAAESSRNIVKTGKRIKDVTFMHLDYRHALHWGSTVPTSPFYRAVYYCDPPYRGTAVYHGAPEFDSDRFFDHVRKVSEHGKVCLVSEYNAPDDFIMLWEKGVRTSLNGQGQRGKRVERLWVYSGTNTADLKAVQAVSDFYPEVTAE